MASAAAGEDSTKLGVLPKLKAAEDVLQLHAKKTKKVRKMMQSVYSDGESYIEHGRQMVALISVYAQELSTVEFAQLETARETLKQVAEFQSKYFDIMRDFNQLFSRDGVKVMEELEARAAASKTDLKRVEKLNDSLESTRKKLSKESSGSSKAKELKETASATEKAIIETGAEVNSSFETLNADFCKFGANFYTAFHENYGHMLNLSKDLWDDTEDESNKLRAMLGKPVKGESAPQTPTGAPGEEVNGNGIEGPMGVTLAELVEAERTQVTQLTHLERYKNKLSKEAEEAKPCVEEDTVTEIFKFSKDIIDMHRAVLEEIDFLGNPRKDMTPAEIEAAKSKPRKTVEPEKLLEFIYNVFNPRLDKMREIYSKYLEHMGMAQGTLERAKRKKQFHSMLHKCQQNTVMYGMFKLDQLMNVIGKYFIGAQKLLQCVLEAGSEVDPMWMNFYEMLAKIAEMNKEFVRIREDSENVHILMGVQEKITNLNKELPDIGRVFLGEENFTCARFIAGKEEALPTGPKPTLEEDQVYHVFLFNDTLMVTQKPSGMKQVLRDNYNFIMEFPINKVVVVPIADSNDFKYTFRMSVEDSGTVFWAASSEAQKSEWVEKIRSAVLSWCNQQVFGTSPEALMKRSADYEDGIVPHVFQDAVDYVEKYGLEMEGIFRISGNARTMEVIRLKLNTGHKVTYDSAFNAAVMVKQWLSSLPVPIMQPQLYDSWHEAAEPKDPEECIPKMIEVVKKLPKLPKFILYIICDLCRKIVAKSSENRMSYQNLSIVFAPSLMRVPDTQEFGSTKRLDTLEKVFLLSDRIFPGVKEEIDEAIMQATVYKEVQMKRKREAVDAIRAKHIREKSVMTTNVVSAQEWMKKRKEELAAQEQKEQEEAEARAKKEREEQLAKQMAEYEARIREEEEKKKAEEEAKAKKEQMAREAEEKARKDFEEHEKKVREMAEKAEKAEQEKQEQEKANRDAERKRRLEAAEAKRKAAEEEAEAAAAAADEYDDDACAGCGKPVDDDDDDAFEALDRLWHADCFVCQHCKKKLGDDDETKAKKGRPYCMDCYGDLFCPVCSGCDKPITGAVLKALDTTWHKQCFKCAKCGKPITGDFTSTPDGKPLCC